MSVLGKRKECLSDGEDDHGYRIVFMWSHYPFKVSDDTPVEMEMAQAIPTLFAKLITVIATVENNHRVRDAVKIIANNTKLIRENTAKAEKKNCVVDNEGVEYVVLVQRKDALKSLFAKDGLLECLGLCAQLVQVYQITDQKTHCMLNLFV